MKTLPFFWKVFERCSKSSLFPWAATLVAREVQREKIMLGLGGVGRIGFNEPLSALQSRTRQKTFTPHTMEQSRHLFEPPVYMPKRAITMGIGIIRESKKSLMVVAGLKKENILAKALEGPLFWPEDSLSLDSFAILGY